MKLNLAVEGRILASVPVEASAVGNDYYLKALRRLLVIRHQQKLAALKTKPVFFVENPLDVALSFPK